MAFPLLLSPLSVTAAPDPILSSSFTPTGVTGPGDAGVFPAGRMTIALGGSPDATPTVFSALPRDMLQLLPLLGLIALALGVGFYAFARSEKAAIARPATRRSRSRPSGLLPGPARWDATPHERLQDAKYLGLILEAELASSTGKERSSTAAIRSLDASTTAGETPEPPPDPASAA